MGRTRVFLRAPRLEDEAEFLRSVRRSRRLLRPWAGPPASRRGFRAYLARNRSDSNRGYLVCIRATREIAGVVNLSEIVRGCFKSAYLGYHAFLPHAGQGYMAEGMRLVVARAFGRLSLHRLEANIQPRNAASIALVRRLGFRKEGLSRRYLKIGGRWRDHERWAILVEDWRGRGQGGEYR
jgi:ribosomal-protein-alanine N-acetyltransferase